MKKVFFALIFIVFVSVVYTQRVALRNYFQESEKPNVPAIAFNDVGAPFMAPDEIEAVDVIRDQGVSETEESDESSDIELSDPVTSSIPKEFNLAVPFTSQAPYSNWDAVHEETCEEASSLMVAYYFQEKNNSPIDQETAEYEMERLRAYEDAFLGVNMSTNAEQTAAVIETYYYLSPEVVLNPTVEDIKTALAAGFPVVVPAAGRELGNPNFTGEGPLYHMLVIKGYTEEGFITNDPGTRNGADYFYTFDVLMNAIHDWNDGDVLNGQKIVIIVRP